MVMSLSWMVSHPLGALLIANTCILTQVREACSLLDLDVLFYPCPKDGPNWRPKVGVRYALERRIASMCGTLFLTVQRYHMIWWDARRTRHCCMHNVCAQ